MTISTPIASDKDAPFGLVGKLIQQPCFFVVGLRQRQAAIFDCSRITHGYTLNATKTYADQLRCVREKFESLIGPKAGARPRFLSSVAVHGRILDIC